MKAHCYKVRDESEESFYQLGRKEAIKEVVDWIDKNCDLEKCDPAIVTAEWQVQKKDWGINED